MRIGLFLLVASFVSGAFGGTEHEHPPVKMPEEFKMIQDLKGTWKSPAGKKKEEQVTVTYEISPNGNTVVEKLFAGTKHEMVSVYHSNEGKLALSHYCSLGNKPELNYKGLGSDKKSMAFEMEGVQGISDIKQPHIHGLTLKFIGKDEIEHEWTSFKDGKKEEKPTIFRLKRVKKS